MSTHNPDSLTPEQVGTQDGWRLLDEDERPVLPTYPEGLVEYLVPSTSAWQPGNGGSPYLAYRTKRTPEQLAEACASQLAILLSTKTRRGTAREDFLAGHSAAPESTRETIERLTREREAALGFASTDPQTQPPIDHDTAPSEWRTGYGKKGFGFVFFDASQGESGPRVWVQNDLAYLLCRRHNSECATLRADLAKAREERDLARTAGHLLERVRDAAWAECQTLRAELSAAEAKIVCFADDGTTATTWERLAEDRSQEMARLKVELSAANARAATAERERDHLKNWREFVGNARPGDIANVILERDELRQKLAFAEDAAAKGEYARLNAGALEEGVNELRQKVAQDEELVKELNQRNIQAANDGYALVQQTVDIARDRDSALAALETMRKGELAFQIARSLYGFYRGGDAGSSEAMTYFDHNGRHLYGLKHTIERVQNLINDALPLASSIALRDHDLKLAERAFTEGVSTWTHNNSIAALWLASEIRAELTGGKEGK